MPSHLRLRRAPQQLGRQQLWHEQLFSFYLLTLFLIEVKSERQIELSHERPTRYLVAFAITGALVCATAIPASALVSAAAGVITASWGKGSPDFTDPLVPPLAY